MQYIGVKIFINDFYLENHIQISTLAIAIKVEKTLKGSLDSITSPSVKIQIMDGKVFLRCKGKTLLGVVLPSYIK